MSQTDLIMAVWGSINFYSVYVLIVFRLGSFLGSLPLQLVHNPARKDTLGVFQQGLLHRLCSAHDGVVHVHETDGTALRNGSTSLQQCTTDTYFFKG